MSQERMTSLALVYVHKEIDVGVTNISLVDSLGAKIAVAQYSMR